MDPVFFMQCTKLDKVPAIWSRYSHFKPLKTFPEGYLSLSILGGLDVHIREMIAQGADVNHLDAGQFAPIHYMCLKDADVSFEIWKLLVDKGADINLPTTDGHLPLRMARDAGLVDAVEFLEQRGALES
jgi:ankyrin repeat protein